MFRMKKKKKAKKWSTKTNHRTEHRKSYIRSVVIMITNMRHVRFALDLPHRVYPQGKPAILRLMSRTIKINDNAICPHENHQFTWKRLFRWDPVKFVFLLFYFFLFSRRKTFYTYLQRSRTYDTLKMIYLWISFIISFEPYHYQIYSIIV